MIKSIQEIPEKVFDPRIDGNNIGFMGVVAFKSKLLIQCNSTTQNYELVGLGTGGFLEHATGMEVRSCGDRTDISKYVYSLVSDPKAYIVYSFKEREDLFRFMSGDWVANATSTISKLVLPTKFSWSISYDPFENDSRLLGA